MRRYLTIGFLLICSLAMAQTSELQKVRLSRMEGGQNSKDFFDTLSDNQATHVENLDISNKGQAITRKGQALYLDDVNNTAFVGLGVYYQDSTTNYAVSAQDDDVMSGTGGVWTQISTSSLGTGFDTGFIQANALLFVFNGNVNTAWWNGGVWSSGGGWPTNPPVATTAAWLKNYLFLAGDPVNPDWVYVSDNLDPTTFQAVQIIKINTGDGQKIVRLEPYREAEIIIYKERSIFLLDITGGDTSCSPQPICAWKVTPLSRDIGTPARRSVVPLGNDQWFLSGEPFAVRSLVRSDADKILTDMISQPIQDILAGEGDVTLNTNQIAKAAGVLFANKYLLAIPTGSSTVNNYVLVYDFLTKSWTVITGWYPRDWLVYNNNLYYADANDGRVVQCFTGTIGDFGTNPDSSSGPTVAIHSDYQTRGVDFGFPENFKALDALSVEFFPTGNFEAEVSINLDNGGWQRVGAVNLSGDALTLPFNLPVTLHSEGFAIETLQLQQYGEYKRMQARVETDNLEETMKLQAVDLYSRVKPWRRED